jgi:hypothetical protein
MHYARYHHGMYLYRYGTVVFKYLVVKYCKQSPFPILPPKISTPATWEKYVNLNDPKESGKTKVLREKFKSGSCFQWVLSIFERERIEPKY